MNPRPSSRRSPDAGNRRGGQKWIWNATRCAIYARDGFRCVYRVECDGGAPTRLLLDHMTPRAEGGDNAHDNLVTTCDACNLAKGDRSLDAWLLALGAAGYKHVRSLRTRVAQQTFLPIDAELGRLIEAHRPRGRSFTDAIPTWERFVAQAAE
jgi:hypothetical protein